MTTSCAVSKPSYDQEDVSSIGSSIVSSDASVSSYRSVTWKETTCSPSRLQEELVGARHEPRLLSDEEKQVLYFLRPDLSPSDSVSTDEAQLQQENHHLQGNKKKEDNRQDKHRFSDQFKHFMRDLSLMSRQEESDDDDSFFDCGNVDQIRNSLDASDKNTVNPLIVLSRLMRCECRSPADVTEESFPLQNKERKMQYNVASSRQSLRAGIPSLITLSEKI